MDVPRPETVRNELSSMGRVYLVVFVVLVAALLYALMPEDSPPVSATPAVVGPPPQR